MPPTIFEYGNVNMFWPYVVGQSGTDKPESVLVTKLPARIRRTVQATTKREYLWSNDTLSRRSAVDRRAPVHCRRPTVDFWLVRCGRARGRLEREGDFLRFLRADGDRLRRGAELLVPRFDRVGAGRQRLDVERAVRVGHREVRVIEDADVGVHPAVHVALEGDHHFLRGEGVRHLHALDRLAVVELLVRFRHRVDVVQRRIAVDDFERLADANAE